MMAIRGRLLALAFAAVAIWPAAVHAQVSRGEIRLRVLDPVGQGLAGAEGTLASEAPALSRAFVTDADGQTTLGDLPFGVYRLSVRLQGFVARTQVVDVHSATPIALQLRLDVGLAVTEQVSAPLVDTRQAGVVYSINAPAIQEALPAVPGRRLLDLVDAQPGWLMEANGVLHPRGSEYQTLFVVDGLPMDENRSPAFAPEIQEGDVQAMNVLTGNFPAEYGRKLGGVVEVTTAQDIRRGWHGAADVGGGSFGSASGGASATYGWDRRAITVSGSAARTSRYLDPPVTDNFTNDGSFGGVSAAYDDRPTDHDRLRVTWRHSRTTFQVPNEQIQEAAGQLQERTGTDDLVQGAWTRIIGTRFVLNVRGVGTRLGATLSSNEQSTPIIVSQDRSLTRGYGNVSLAADYGRHQVKFGGDLVFAPVREELAYIISDPSFFDPDTASTFQFDDHKHDHEQSLFVQDTIAAGPFTISAGVRWDRYAFVVDDQAVSPRLGVAWAAPNGSLVLRAAYDRAFQTPAVENLLLASSPDVDAVGNVMRVPVEPSRGHYVEGGVTAALGSRARLDATAYRRTFRQFADDDVFLNTGVTFPIAFDSATINGFDAKMTLLPWRRFSGFASYALLKGTSQLPFTGGLFLGAEAISELEQQGEVPITQDQRHTVRGHLRFDVSTRLWTGATVRYGSGLPVELEGDVDLAELESQYGAAVLNQVDFEEGRVKANFAIDLGAGLQLWRTDRRRAMLRVEVANLTNCLNVINFAGIFSGTALGAPRSATVRLQFVF
jgi:Carboxypeptidase regulatory-like domain